MFRPSRNGVTLFAAAVLISTAHVTGAKPPGDHVWSIRREVETPHIPWARPLPGGPIRTLFIVPAAGTRDAVELAQRLEMQVNAWITRQPARLEGTWSYGRQLAGSTTQERLADLRDKLTRKYDLFVVGNVKWDMIPIEQRADIYEQVSDGAGLLFVMQRGSDTEYRNRLRQRPLDDGGYILRGVPLGLLEGKHARPETDGREVPLAATYTLGAGRAVEISWPAADFDKVIEPSLAPAARMSEERMAVQEYYYSVLARAALWAARRDGRTALGGWPEEALQIEQDAGPQSCRLTLSDAAGVTGTTLSTRFRDRWGRLAAQEARALEMGRGNGEFSLDIPQLPVGRHMVDCIVRANGASIDWGTVVLEVTGPVRLKDVGIEWIFDVGDRVGVSAQLAGDTSKADVFRVELVDEKGRVTARADSAIEAGEGNLLAEIPIECWTGPALTVRLSALDDGTARDCLERKIYVRPPDQTDDFHFLMWINWGGLGVGYPAYAGDHVLKSYGFNVYYPPMRVGSAREVHGYSRPLMHNGLLVVPHALRDVDTRAESIRESCLTSAEFVQKRREYLDMVGKAGAPYGYVWWSMGDESGLVDGEYDVCWSPTCLAFFRNYLKKHFGTVQALNQAWGMAFSSWDEIVPQRRTPPKTRHTPPIKVDASDGEVAMWIAHRLAMSEVFVNTMKLNSELIREHDPGARVGLEGMYRETPWAGYNFEKMCRAYDALLPYDEQRDQVELVRSFRDRNDITGGIFGGYMNDSQDAVNEGIVWNHLFNDANMLMWWTVAGAPGAIGGDLAPSWFLRRCVEPMQLIRGGLGRQVRQMERLHDGIAILYSYESICAAGINEDFELAARKIELTTPRVAWQAALEELGLQYDYITSDQAATLDPAGEFKVLILPYTQAMPAKVADGIRAFAKAGGTVIADARPGIYDRLGMRLPVGALDDVFGIERERRGTDAIRQAAFEVRGALGDIDLDARIPKVRLDGEVRTRSARALARVDAIPAVATARFGGGKAVLLNFLLDGFHARRIEGKEDGTLVLLKDLLAWAGVTPAVKLITRDNNLKGFEVVRLRQGETSLVALMRGGWLKVADAGRGRLAFEEAMHTYDVRRRTYLGEIAELPFNLNRGQALILARLPYRVAELRVAARDARQGQSVDLSIALNGAPETGIRHVLKLEFVGSDGEIRPTMAQKLITSSGRCHAQIPIAWNDPPGTWTVRVTDVVTGVRAQQEFRINTP